jgi:serine/threonine-protein kinase
MRQGEIVRDTYTIVRHLGSGAFGDVYLARHRCMGLQAMKVFAIEDGVDVLEEAYLLTKLSHPNIVRMFEANEFLCEGKRLGYFTMEYIEGGTLSEYLQSDVPGLPERTTLALDILAGLAVAHSQNPPVIHRDISPSNILVDKSQRRPLAKISDFGMAKHVNPDSLVASAGGKYLYMAPESFLGTHSTATDVYAVGIVVFEMLTGMHPFDIRISPDADAKEIARIVCASRSQRIPVASKCNSEISPEWDSVLTAALAHEPELRPQTAQDFLSSLSARATSDGEPEQFKRAMELAREAALLARQVATLDQAISLLERASQIDGNVAARYADRLSLWKSGIVL